ncbi:MAG: CBS domain-containing protein [Gammaproteobacteria bacterium]|nr:CBS domain-containing protein [Gammaproteobacteria bacterium]
MKKKPNLMAAMTPFPYSVQLHTLLSDATKLMQEHEVHHLPIMEQREIVGVITKHDIKARGALLLENEDEGKLQVKDACISVPYIVDINEPLENVLLTMAKKHQNSALVTKHDKLVGIFTYIDVCRYLGLYLKEKFSTSDGNEAA